MAQLEEYARRHGQDPATVLDGVLADYLDWERQDYQEAVEEAFEELREKHGLPR